MLMIELLNFFIQIKNIYLDEEDILEIIGEKYNKLSFINITSSICYNIEIDYKDISNIIKYV